MSERKELLSTNFTKGAFSGTKSNIYIKQNIQISVAVLVKW
ncbi:hypothetical protein [Treponema sp.]|nr:hypothetical protein [Treponema sp.]